MAEQQSNKKEIKITPAGVALYPKLNEPDTKFKAEGQYSVKLRLSAEDAQELIDEIDSLADAAFEEALAEAKNEREKKKIKRADPAYSAEEDEDGKETGNFLFNFKMAASGVSKKTGKEWTRTCPVFDAKRKPIDLKTVQIGSGSVVKVAYVLSPFSTAIGVGVSLRLEAVQVLERREWGSRDASAFGFGDEEGFEAEENTGSVFNEGDGDEEKDGDF